ncbi:hypothetical protein ACHAXT_004139 [Thalassiosira profunda]
MRRARPAGDPRAITRGAPYQNDGGDAVPPLALKLLGPLAPILLSDDLTDAEELQTRLRVYSLSLLGTSAFFWLWAAYNTYHLRHSGGFDLGVASFLGSGTSSLLLLRSSLGGRWRNPDRRYGCWTKQREVGGVHGIAPGDAPIHKPPGKYLRAFAAVTQVLVAANYGLGVMFAFTAGKHVYIYFATYCVLFAILWLLAAVAGWVLISAYREAVRRTYGDEAVDGPPRQSCVRWVLIALTQRSMGHTGAAIRTGDYFDDEEEEDDRVDDELPGS